MSFSPSHVLGNASNHVKHPLAPTSRRRTWHQRDSPAVSDGARNPLREPGSYRMLRLVSLCWQIGQAFRKIPPWRFSAHFVPIVIHHRAPWHRPALQVAGRVPHHEMCSHLPRTRLRAVVCIPVAVLVYKYVFSLLKHPFPPMLHERLLWLAGFACCPVSSLQPSLFGPYALERAAGRQAGVRFDRGLRRRSGSVACAVSDAPSTAAGTAEPPVR